MRVKRSRRHARGGDRLEFGVPKASNHVNDAAQYAVFLYPQALETLGAVVEPYLTKGSPQGPHIVCSEVDSSGMFFGLTVLGKGQDGQAIEADLLMPSGFIKLVVSLHNDHPFGFRSRITPLPQD